MSTATTIRTQPVYWRRALGRGRSREVLSGLVGRRAVYTAWDGTEVVGTVTGELRDLYVVIRTDDGRWARLGDTVRVVVEA